MIVYIREGTGNLLEERRIVGLDDRYSSETDDVVTAFAYTDGTGVLPAGLVTEVVDAEGSITAFAYYTDADRLGLLHTVTYAFGTADEAQVEYFHDPLTRNMTAFEDELDRRTDYVLDNLDRVTQVIEPAAPRNLSSSATSMIRSATFASRRRRWTTPTTIACKSPSAAMTRAIA